MSTDWNAKIDLSKIKKESYRARLKQMFDYMSKTEIGSYIISTSSKVELRTTTGESYVIVRRDKSYIYISEKRFSQPVGWLEQSMLHELGHVLTRYFRVMTNIAPDIIFQDKVKSFLQTFFVDLKKKNLTKAQYNNIFSGFDGFKIDSEQNTQEFTKVSSLLLFDEFTATDMYYVPDFDSDRSFKTFKYSNPPVSKPGRLAGFKDLISTIQKFNKSDVTDIKNSIDLKKKIFETIDKAAKQGLLSKEGAKIYKEVWNEKVKISDNNSDNSRLSEGGYANDNGWTTVTKDENDNITGWERYKINENGELDVVESKKYIYQTASDGKRITDSNGDDIRVGEIVFKDSLTVLGMYKPGTEKIISVDIKIRGNPVPFEFSDIGSALGQQLGYRLAGGNAALGVLSSALLQTIGDNLGDVLDGVISGGNIVSGAAANGKSVTGSVNVAFSEFGDELLTNLKSAGVGAISSFLTAQLVKALGADGFAGEILNTTAGAVIGQIVQGIATGTKVADIFKALDVAQVGNALGSFLGTKLASELVTFDSIGGQLGSAVGSAVASSAAAAAIGAATPTGLTATFAQFGLAGGIAGVAIAAFLGFIIGGLIGSVFGGTPRSGADAQWDDAQGKFIVANVYSRKGGSKDAARSLASVAAETFNDVLAATGGRLARPGDVTAGNYGMRGSDLVYRPTSTQDSNLITYRVSAKDKDAGAKITNYGIYQGLTDPDFQIIGGSNYVKRAVYATLEIGGVSATNFDPTALFGNIASAQAYESYLSNSAVINAIVAAESDSVFAIETAINLARAVELGLTKRHRSDWFGGFNALLTEAGTNAARVEFGYDYDAFSGQISRIIGVGDYVFGDTIDIAGQTTIEAGEGADIIDLRSGKLANQIGFTVNGTLNNDIAVSGADFTALSSSVSFAAGALRSSVTVTIANDGVAEARENFIASLSNAPNMRIMGGDAVATIIDGAAALPSLMVGDSFAWEDDGFVLFRLSLSKAANVAITVALALANDKASGGGVDYGAVDAGNVQVSADGVTWVNATSATFAAGATELFVRTAVVADNVPNPDYVAPDFDPETGQTTAGNGAPQFLNVEGNERFTLSATVTAGASALANGGAAVSGTGTIVDGVGNEPLVWIDHVVVDEASGQAKFTISRSRALAAATTVAFATADRKVLDIDIAATVDGGAGDDVIYANDNDAPEYGMRIVA